MSAFHILQEKVLLWAKERDILAHSTPKAQVMKTMEEASELLEAATRLTLIRQLRKDVKSEDSVIWDAEEQKAALAFDDAAGDVLVTIIIACALAKVDPLDCLALAYDEIKDRKGRLLPNGIFQKEQ